MGAWLLPDLVGRATAMDLVLTGRWLEAAEALALGLVNRVCDDPEPVAAAIAADLAGRGRGRCQGGDGGRRAARSLAGRTGGQPFGLGPRAGRSMSDYQDWSLDGWRTHLPGVTDVPDYVARLGGDSLPALAAAAASAVPDRIAVTVDGEPVTHAELDEASARVAAWLARRVRPGDRVLLAAGSSIGFVRCYLGALRAGAVVVLANPGYTAAELGHLAADSGAVLAFADREPARRLAGLGLGLQVADARELPADCGWPPGWRPGRTRWRCSRTPRPTGRPKGVPLTHRQLTVSIRAAMAAWQWRGDDVLVHALPVYHQHGRACRG